jgi:hypothetical protein
VPVHDGLHGPGLHPAQPRGGRGDRVRIISAVFLSQSVHACLTLPCQQPKRTCKRDPALPTGNALSSACFSRSCPMLPA